MKIYVVENRDVQDGYMSIEDIFNNYQLAIKNSKSIGEPFWHEITVVEHNIKHITSDVFVVQAYANPEYKIFNYEHDAINYANMIGLNNNNIIKYKLK